MMAFIGYILCIFIFSRTVYVSPNNLLPFQLIVIQARSYIPEYMLLCLMTDYALDFWILKGGHSYSLEIKETKPQFLSVSQ